MSAIWGVIDLNKKCLTEGEVRYMEEVYRSKKIDRIDTFFQFHFYLGCGIQYVTEEAAREQFPYMDGKSRFLVADVILDNRAELQKKYICAGKRSKDGVDGSILFDAVSENMERALDEMLGAYAFALYDEKADKLQLVSDAVGNRSVYYRVEEGKVYFSSLLEPILMFCKKKEINEEWYHNFFDQDNLRVVAEARLTPYQGIYRVEPGEIVTITPAGVERRAYWDPFKNRKTGKESSDEAYRNKVLSVFGACVEDVIRKGKETAILLSGGLDSNAVAAFAAPKLKTEGRKLYSYTSVPDGEKKRIPQNAYYVEDESEYIEELEKYHTNLEPAYIDSSKGDFWEENRKIRDILEIPFKTVLNMPWIYRAYKQAAQAGCGIMLSGQYGNITISYGDFRCLFVTLLRKGKVFRLIKEVNAYSKCYKKSRKWIYKDLLKAKREDDFAHYSRYMYDKVALRQMGETELKFSLETGIIPRDPTRDKRLIELVLSLPQEQFVKNGTERRLVREYMKELIPEKIVSDRFHRGRQGVGSERLMRAQWQEIVPILHKILEVPGMETFFDLKAAKEKLATVDSAETGKDEYEMVKPVYLGLTCEYLEKMYGTKI